jgi:putative tryptophan/tyrosine transport system substrate-binding protein
MRRRTVLSGVGPLLLASFQHSVHAWGQAQSLRRIGVIGNLSPLANPAVVPLWNAFLTGLRDRGWEEGRNLVIEARWPEGRMETAIEFAAELVALNPEVILCSNSQVLEALRQRTATIPIVFAGVSHPVEAGFVKSMAHPGGNITGITNLLDVVVEKHIELLKELKPGLEKIAVLWSPGNAGSAISAKWMMESVAPRSGITISGVPLDSPDEIASALSTLARERPQALHVHPTPAIAARRAEIAAFAIEQRLPTISGGRHLARDGLLMFYGADETQLWRVGATYVDRILRGAKPADLPVQMPTAFELILNLKTAKALGLTISPTLLARADEVIE